MPLITVSSVLPLLLECQLVKRWRLRGRPKDNINVKLGDTKCEGVRITIQNPVIHSLTFHYVDKRTNALNVMFLRTRLKESF